MTQDSYVKKFIKDEKITRISFLANAGGLLGLCMGFSVISVAEIFYHCLVSLATSFNRANGGAADKTAADNEDAADTVVSCAEVAAVGRVEYERPEYDTAPAPAPGTPRAVSPPPPPYEKCYSLGVLGRPCSVHHIVATPQPYGPFFYLPCAACSSSGGGSRQAGARDCSACRRRGHFTSPTAAIGD